MTPSTGIRLKRSNETKSSEIGPYIDGQQKF